jgi:hypothetical protein
MTAPRRLEHDAAEYFRGDFVVAHHRLAAYHGGRASEQARGRQPDGVLACAYRDVARPARAENHRSRPCKAFGVSFGQLAAAGQVDEPVGRVGRGFAVLRDHDHVRPLGIAEPGFK